MSAYGHEMDREHSVHSLPSRWGSEFGSRYISESGIYTSSFAATIFISGLVTVGVSLLSLLVAMAMMLRSCESRNSGAVELYRYMDNYDYCRNFVLQAELNRLGSDSYPTICKDIGTLYLKGRYKRDLTITLGIAEEFFDSIRPENDGRDVVLMDADDFLASNRNQLMHRFNGDAFYDNSREADYVKRVSVMRSYLKLQSAGWKLILLSRKPKKLHNETLTYLISMGCHVPFSLVMRTENEMQMNFQEFLSRQRSMLQKDGFRMVASISSQMDALRGEFLGNRIFKLPDPIFRYRIDDSTGNRIHRE